MSKRLPKGWAVAKVRDVGNVQLGRQRSPGVHHGTNMVPYLRVANVFEDRIDLSDVMQMHFEPEEVERFRLVPGDILLNEGQSRELVGRPAMYRGELPGACFTNSLVRFQASEALDKKYALELFRHWLKSGVFQSIAQITTNIAHLGSGRFAELDLPLGPLNEQRRIVAKLEALQARSRRAREALDAVPPLLEKLRQSILAAAFRGDLTKDWRAQNPNTEPATALLARIRTERRKKWEESELAKLKAKGKPPTDDRWKAKYKEPEPVDTTGLPELPGGWCWATAEELTDAVRSIIYGIIKAGPHFPGGVPYVRVTEVAAGRIVRDELPCCDPARAAKFARSVLSAGDILVSKDGTIGRVVFVPPELEGANINQHVLRVVPAKQIDRYFLARMIEAPQCQRWMTGEVKGIALQGVNVEDFRRMPVPLAPRAEQSAIVASVAKSLDTQSRTCEFVKAADETMSSLEQALLAKAFRGELVPQDPSDEPAEALLARVRAATPSAAKPGRSRGGAKAAE